MENKDFDMNPDSYVCYPDAADQIALLETIVCELLKALPEPQFQHYMEFLSESGKEALAAAQANPQDAEAQAQLKRATFIYYEVLQMLEVNKLLSSQISLTEAEMAQHMNDFRQGLGLMQWQS